MTVSILLLVLSCIASHFGIKLYLGYARKLHILDVPNDRSSHTLPTPRGAGLAFASVYLLGIGVLGAFHILRLHELIALLAGTFVAAVGFWDDRRGLPIWSRLLVQVVSSVVVVLSLAAFHIPGHASSSLVIITLLMTIEVFGLTWMLNLTNFMDGIDGIVGVEVLTVTAVCTVLILSKGGTVSAVLFALLGITIAPFLLFNWSPAKVFMGDVGSCFIGFTLGVLSLIAVARGELSLLVPVILLAVFISDATITLLTRMLTGQQWHLPHRTHGFQILAAEFGHSRVSASIGVVNLLWLAPLAAAAHFDQAHGIIYAITAFAPLLLICRFLGVGIAPAVTSPVLATGGEAAFVRQVNGPGWVADQARFFLRRFFPSLQLALMALLSVFCVVASLLSHLSSPVSSNARTLLIESVLLWSFCQSLVLAYLGLHRRHWRFTSLEEFPTLVGISILGSATGALCAGTFARMHGIQLPQPMYLLEGTLSILAFAGLRISTGYTPELWRKIQHRNARTPVIICSADISGVSMLSELRLHCPEYHPVGFIDARPEIHGISICGLRVLGKPEDLTLLIRKHSVQHVFMSESMQRTSVTEKIRRDCLANNANLHMVSSFAIT